MIGQIFAFWCSPGWPPAKPRLFQAEGPVLGHVLLEAEDGEAEAMALVRIGYNCALSHAPWAPGPPDLKPAIP
jgi:hypothetical protein